MKTMNLLFITFLLTSCWKGSTSSDSGGEGGGGQGSCSDTYCKIFLSATTTRGNLDLNGNGNPVEEADAICANDPAKPAGVYKAMFTYGSHRRACSSTDCTTGGTEEHIDWVLKPNTEYRRADGVTVIGTTNIDGIFPLTLSGGLDNALTDTYETAWSGLASGWRTMGMEDRICNYWRDSTVSYNGTPGCSNNKGSNFISCSFESCGIPRKIYCVEQ